MSQGTYPRYNIFLIVFILLSALFAFLWWQEKNKSAPPNPQSNQEPKAVQARIDTTRAAQNWFELNSLAEAYSAKLVTRSDLRNAANGPLRPVDVAIGNVYMKSFRNSMGTGGANNTKAIILTKDELAFYTTYLQLTGLPEIQASFGRYDRALLTSTGGLMDPELEARPTRDQRLTLLFGIPISPRPAAGATNYTAPFVVGGKSFYDDWHDSWP